MPASKLFSLCKVAIATLFITASCQASAGYYIEYQADSCHVCNTASESYYHPVRHVRSHYRHHPRYHHYRHSSASISVTYYWAVYPDYRCGDACVPVVHCNSCCHRCGGVREVYSSDPSYDAYFRGGSEPQYREYRRRDRDYDTSTADDTNY